MSERARVIGNLEALLECRVVDAALAKKTDDEIAGLLVEHVWARMAIASPQILLLEETIERLRSRSVPASDPRALALEEAALIAEEPSAFVEDADAKRERRRKAARIRALSGSESPRADDVRRAMALNEEKAERIRALERHLRALGACVHGDTHAVKAEALTAAMQEWERVSERDT